MAMTPGVRTTTLPNGLTIVSDCNPSSALTSVSIGVRFGSRYENEQTNGIAHFLEHMMFKGTKKLTVESLAQSVEARGIDWNAFTSKEQTVYLMEGLAEHGKFMVETLADMLVNSQFPQDELDRERGVVKEEIKRAEDNPGSMIRDGLQRAAYGDTPYGRNTLGPSKNIDAFPRQLFVDTVRQNYVGGNMVVTVSGQVDHDDLVRQVKGLMGHVPRGRQPVPQAAVYVGGESRISKPDMKQAQMFLALPSVPSSHPDAPAFEMLAAVLGGGMSSRLFTEVREKRGLCYTTSASCYGGKDNGLFVAYVGTDPATLGQATNVIIDEIKRVGLDVTQAELDRAKASVRTTYAQELDSTGKRRSVMEMTMLETGKPLDVPAELAKYQAVTLDDLKRVAAQLVQGKPTLSVIGKLDTLAPYAEIAARFGGNGPTNDAKAPPVPTRRM